MQNIVNVAILENHQGTIDGYTYRLKLLPGIRILTTCIYAEELDELSKSKIDLLITGIDVYVSKENKNPFPILYFVNSVKNSNPNLKFLIISSNIPNQMVSSLIELGVDGLMLKEDQQAILRLGEIVEIIAGGGVYISSSLLKNLFSKPPNSLLTKRQLEIISLCVAYPDEDTLTLAKRLNISGSTFRNLLSAIYGKLNVRTRVAAILKAKQLGIIPSPSYSEYSQDREVDFE